MSLTNVNTPDTNGCIYIQMTKASSSILEEMQRTFPVCSKRLGFIVHENASQQARLPLGFAWPSSFRYGLSDRFLVISCQVSIPTHGRTSFPWYKRVVSFLLLPKQSHRGPRGHRNIELVSNRWRKIPLLRDASWT